MADIILSILIFLPLALTILLKGNAALSFLVLCGSFTFITFGSADVAQLTGHLDLRVNSSTINLVILIAPMILTLLLCRRAFSGQLKSILHWVTALCAGALLALVSVPLLNDSVRADFNYNWAWDGLQKIQTPVIAAGFVLSLLLVWFTLHPKHSKKHK